MTQTKHKQRNILFGNHTIMQEHFYGGGKMKRLSRRELQEMKKNMKKVKDIAEKSKAYHQNEVQQMEQFLQQQFSEQMEK
jgi:coenzyme F420-reducing hydrogenase alpha subunit